MVSARTSRRPRVEPLSAGDRRSVLRRVGALVAASEPGPIRIVRGDDSEELPAELVDLVRRAVAALEKGDDLTDLGDDRLGELSSQQVADLLNVSRPFVVKLAHDGRLAHRMVGNRHRFDQADVAEFQRSFQRSRRRALAELSPVGGYTAADF